MLPAHLHACAKSDSENLDPFVWLAIGVEATCKLSRRFIWGCYREINYQDSVLRGGVDPSCFRLAGALTAELYIRDQFRCVALNCIKVPYI